jgi:hypothetical protein
MAEKKKTGDAEPRRLRLQAGSSWSHGRTLFLRGLLAEGEGAGADTELVVEFASGAVADEALEAIEEVQGDYERKHDEEDEDDD